MTFQLDTRGVVPRHGFIGVIQWPDLTPFTQGAIGAALSGPIFGWPSGEDGLYATPRFSDLHPATLARIIADCEQMEGRGLSDAGLKNSGDKGGTFWRLRQANIYPSFPPLTLYLGDDGLIHLREG